MSEEIMEMLHKIDKKVDIAVWELGEVKKDVACVGAKTELTEKRVDKLYNISGVLGWVVAVAIPALGVFIGLRKGG